jgi:hypothetical protein
MLWFVPNPVNSFGTTAGLSTGCMKMQKLSKMEMGLQDGLQTVFDSRQVVEITVENSLVHRKRHALSTTTIEI